MYVLYVPKQYKDYVELNSEYYLNAIKTIETTADTTLFFSYLNEDSLFYL